MTEEPRKLSAYGNVKIKRRKPKKYGFLKGLIIFATVLLFITAACSVVFWKYMGMTGDADPDIFVKNLVAKTDADGWKQLLRHYLPDTYPKYENGADLAYKVLSPSFSVGNVTWLRKANPDTPEYMFFSDGTRFAVMTLHDKSDSKIGLGDWEIEKITFDIEYFSIEFPKTVVVCPAEGNLSLNGTEVQKERADGSCAYPALSPGEEKSGPDCLSYTFTDLWFAPGISCEYKGQNLECVRDDENRFYYFVFPQNEVHSITVTVPAGVTAYVGNKELTTEWAKMDVKEGKLGSLDDGGTGTLPMLNVWTVDGLFEDTPVRAEVYGHEVSLLSSDNGNYIFDTPAECKYTITVAVPKGATVKINGKIIDPKNAEKLGIGELGIGGTVLGRYDVADLSAVDAAVPEFEKYTLKGYLAMPYVSVTLDGAEMTPCNQSVDAYEALWEYDYMPTDPLLADEARVKGAESFVDAYIAYTTGGGAWNDKENEENFNANYEKLKSLMIEGTSGFVSVMESYRSVNHMQHYDTYTLGNLKLDNYVVYTDKCISCRISCDVLRTIETADANGYVSSVGNTISVTMSILQVYYNGEWRVWGFLYE